MMLARIFTARFNPVLGGFDDNELCEFIKDKEVLAIRDHFFVKDEIPYLALVVIYYPVRHETVAPASAPKGKRDESWREILAESDLPLFNTLRSWRGERCKKDGIPPYVICNNRQTAEVAKARPQSLAALGKIAGFGKSKLEKYGQALLDIVSVETTKRQVTGKEEASKEEESVENNHAPDKG